MDEAWEARLASVWASYDEADEPQFLSRIDRFLIESPPGDAIGKFERGAAQDSTGHPEEAIELYRGALASGLAGERRRRAVIQLASSLRNVGQAEEAVALLTAELDQPSDALDGAVQAFLALGLTDLGREREAVSVSLLALARVLPRYNRSLAHYAAALHPTD